MRRPNPETTPAYRRGDAKLRTAFVLSAPGRYECRARRPAAGQTGVTLEMALELFRDVEPCAFPSRRLDDYTCLSAWDRTEYRALTGRTEATEAEVLQPDNLGRVAQHLRDMEFVVALGDRAQLVVRRVWHACTLFTGCHPSLQRLNTKYRSNANTRLARRKDRTRQWAQEVLDSKRVMGRTGSAR